MGAAGSPYAAFRRALAARNATLALAEARDLPPLSLADALELLLVLADQYPEKFRRGVVRWHARYCCEVPGVGPAESAVVLAALEALGGAERAVGAAALAAVLTRRGASGAERALRSIDSAG